MPKKPKQSEPGGEGNWSEDQKRREYYYDDAHGYEEYDPEEDEPEADADEDSGEPSDSRAGASPPS